MLITTLITALQQLLPAYYNITTVITTLVYLKPVYSFLLGSW